ncbi:lysozyme [Qipengyuania sp. XHP0211]|uniref:lysozyme n=1 Tax=Qipengyuania sp. XHP0211 TaxID=3038079 RepID=UPI00241D9E59|nr:lysozyme [Qipengyuania sp. XHP0211]MDG5749977.1 lysozyme [Qipengyuania sp. XHP0211]
MNRKSVFDAVRRLLGRGFRQSEVDALDRALDEATGVATESRDGVQHKASQRGIDLIKRFEGCARVRRDGLVEAYPDPGTGGAPWTIGWGATGAGIGPGTVWTQAQCDARLERDIARHGEDVAQALGNAPTTQAQFDALVSFHYNTGAIARATLTKRHLARDYEAATAEFARWNRAGGQIMQGLVRRREEEARLYRSGYRMNAG